MARQMKVLGIYGSPRKGGNTDLLLDRVLEGAESAGAESSRIYVRDMSFAGCVECNGCDRTGACVVEDDMQKAYPLLLESRVVFLASPVFFYGLTAQVKALIDRCQALWSLRRLTKDAAQRKRYDGGCGFLVMAGAAGGLNLFTGSELTAKYFFDALDKSYGGGAFFRADAAGDVLERPSDMKRAFDFGKEAVHSCG
jgi:multimeric flavodoxin WrbA